jgi:hypothetical protein
MGSRVKFATKHESVQIKNEWRAESMTDVMQPTVEEMKAISAKAYQEQQRKFGAPQTTSPATQQGMFCVQSFTRGLAPKDIQPVHTVQKMVFVCALCEMDSAIRPSRPRAMRSCSWHSIFSNHIHTSMDALGTKEASQNALCRSMLPGRAKSGPDHRCEE